MRPDHPDVGRRRRFEAVRIVLFVTVAAIIYGVLHDQVTAHLCVEYFTIAHPPVFATESPFWLAIGWGILATWWVGLLLGILLALAARLGPAPRLELDALRRPIIGVMVASGVAALISGATGATLVATGIAPVPGHWGDLIATEKQVAFTANAWAHLASYASGAVGGLWLTARTIRRRLRSQATA